MKRSRGPILVTGSHRSGTTWTGQMISAAPHVAYLHEPFNPNLSARVGLNPKPFKYWFQHICEENSDEFVPVFDEIIHYRYSLASHMAKIKSMENLGKVIRDQGWCLWHKMRGDRPLIKDPIALFSAEWLYKKYDMNVLVMLRHPAAFCSSLKIKKWDFDFRNFLNQPLLMDKYLHPFRNEIHEYAGSKKDIIDQAVLLWNCIHHTIGIYREKYPEWLFIKHEDLSADPINQFSSIYRKFDLEFTEQARRKILKSSGVHNPVEQHAENEFIRNSKANIENWKKRLSPDEILKIREKTADMAGVFYGNEDW